MVVCVCWSAGVIMKFVWRSQGVGMGVLGRGGDVFGGVAGWDSEFWISGIVYILTLTRSMSTVCLTQYGQKVNLVSFAKTLNFRLFLVGMSSDESGIQSLHFYK